MTQPLVPARPVAPLRSVLSVLSVLSVRSLLPPLTSHQPLATLRACRLCSSWTVTAPIAGVPVHDHESGLR